MAHYVIPHIGIREPRNLDELKISKSGIDSKINHRIDGKECLRIYMSKEKGMKSMSFSRKYL